jgi:hypothetical protein
MGGQRIGKKLNERKSNEPPNERLEWDQDGQYYHYLTKWMHALNCTGQVAGDPTYARWAIELAKAAHARFTYTPPSGGKKRIYWKMSIDLTYPLVPSMGQHDPLDGFVTYCELEIAEMAEICRGINLVTYDPLGIGGLLFDAFRIFQLMIQGHLWNPTLLELILSSALIGMEAFAIGGTLEHPAEYRLAFRDSSQKIAQSRLPALENLS